MYVKGCKFPREWMGWRSGEADRTEWRGEEKALWRGYQAERVKTWVRDPFRVQHRILGLPYSPDSVVVVYWASATKE
jgi:hypothetical protein